MSRSQYSDDCEHLELYRATVERSIKGQRGQNFLRSLARAMDEMDNKILISGELIDSSGNCCAIGVVCKNLGIDVTKVDYEDPKSVGDLVDTSGSMAAEIEYLNDDEECWHDVNQESR